MPHYHQSHQMLYTGYQPEPSLYHCNFTPSPPSSEDLELAPESPVDVSLQSPVTPPFFVETPTTSIFSSRAALSSSGRSSPRIPRPRNAFMIFRSEHCGQSKITRSVEHDHRHISRIIGHLWNKLPEEKKEIYRAKAEREKFEHNMKYPNYRFAPGVREKKPIRRKVKRNGSMDLLRCEKVADLLMEGKQGGDLEVALMSGNGEPVSPAQEGSTAKTLTKKKRGTQRLRTRGGSPTSSCAASSTCSSPSIQGWSPRNNEASELVDMGPAFLSPLLPPIESPVEAPWMDSLQYPPSQSVSPSPPPSPQQFAPPKSFQAPTSWSNGQNDYVPPTVYLHPNMQSQEYAAVYYPSDISGNSAPCQQSMPSQNGYAYVQYPNAAMSSAPYDAATAQGPVSFRNPWYDNNPGLQVPNCASVDPLDMSAWVNPMYTS
ncbi:hypothetical protein V5O48_004571 [Marasmius crinis-equi]|uniref:HMG box domain-containing protein n=1 Tax=Marasmius crinis-equi TaxID=585013 RepID=A0ABR3FPW8_9AGAR